MTSKELVYNALEGKNISRAPRQLWTLPWAYNTYPKEMEKIAADFPNDIVEAQAILKQPFKVKKGDQYEIGEYLDEWGCVFTNVYRGIIGEVKTPLVNDEEWEDADEVHIPEELLSFDVEQVNADIKKRFSDKFVLAGYCIRPFEQLQFIRGTENFYMDLMFRPQKMMEFIEKMHDFYCRLVTKWAQTDIDGIQIFDDWGSQKSLLINPKTWEEIFMPMYRDYIDIAHKHGKKAFMHSDGNTLAIIPKLIDIGLDAFNTQIFCIGVENLKQFKGKLTFWGEIDRQHILPYGTQQDVRDAVRKQYETLWDNGKCIAECEFSAGAKPENVYAVFDEWDKLTKNG